eukprot:785679_1
MAEFCSEDRFNSLMGLIEDKGYDTISVEARLNDIVNKHYVPERKSESVHEQKSPEVPPQPIEKVKASGEQTSSQEPKPISETPTLISEEPKPISEAPKPVSEELKHISEEPALIAKEPKMVSEDTMPTDKPPAPPPKPSPSSSRPPSKPPSRRSTLSSLPEAKPISGEHKPVSEEPKPVSEEAKPISGVPKTAEDVNPTSEGRKPTLVQKQVEERKHNIIEEPERTQELKDSTGKTDRNVEKDFPKTSKSTVPTTEDQAVDSGNMDQAVDSGSLNIAKTSVVPDNLTAKPSALAPLKAQKLAPLSIPKEAGRVGEDHASDKVPAQSPDQTTPVSDMVEEFSPEQSPIKPKPAKPAHPESQPAPSGVPQSLPIPSGVPESLPTPSGVPESEPAPSGATESQPTPSDTDNKEVDEMLKELSGSDFSDFEIDDRDKVAATAGSVAVDQTTSTKSEDPPKPKSH